MPRMKILNALEEQTFESPPVFNSIERKRYFTLPMRLTEILETLRTPTNKVCFLIAAGYFRARRKFFARQFRSMDVELVAARLGFSVGAFNLDEYDRATSMRHQQMIAEVFGYRKFDDEAAELTKREISSLVRSQTRPKLILLEMIQSLVRKKVVVPSYNALANLIVQAINQHKRLLIHVVDTQLSAQQRRLLDALLEKDLDPEDGTGPEDEETIQVRRYRLTLLKKSFQSIKPSKIKSNLADFQLLRGLYLELEPVIAALGLTHEGLR